MEMIELLIAGIFLILLAAALFYRLFKGPSAVDRAVVSDCIDVMAAGALILFAVFSNRSIYLDVAVVLALLGFIGTVLISKYLEGKL